MDLSSPSGASLNEGIGPEQSSLLYATLDHLSTLILDVGRGAYLVAEAYRMIPIRHLGNAAFEHIHAPPASIESRPPPQKRSLGQTEAQKEVPVPHKFHRIPNSGRYSSQGPHGGGAPETDSGVLIQGALELSKLEGPSTCLVFLGIEVDTKALQLRLPEDKLQRLRAELREAIGRKSMTRREIQSLAGLLQHATPT